MYDFCNLWLITTLIVICTSLIIQTAVAKFHRKGTHSLSEFFCNIGTLISIIIMYIFIVGEDSPVPSVVVKMIQVNITISFTLPGGLISL